MVRTKSDPRKVPGAIVHTKCTNVTATAKECHRLYGAAFKTRFTDGVVLEVRKKETDGGRSQTFLYIKFAVAGVTEISKEMLINKIYAGPAPGPRPPSPDVQIVTPARVTHFNYGDGSVEGGRQANLHYQPKNKTVQDPFVVPPGFLAAQKQSLEMY